MNGHDDIHRGPGSVSKINVLGGMARRKRLIVIFTLIGLLAGLGAARFMAPVYVAQARIAIEAAGGQGGIGDRAVAEQVTLLGSPELGRRVVMALQLEKRAGFGVGADGGLLQKILARFGLGGDNRKLTPEQRAMARYLAGLSVQRVPDSTEIAVGFAAGDAASAAEVANTLAETFVNETHAAVPPPQQPVAVEKPSLAPRIAALRRDLAAAEQAVADYRSRPRQQQQPPPEPASAPPPPPIEEISALVARIAIAEAARDEAEAKAEAARAFLAAADPADASIDAFASLSIQRLREDHAAADLRLADLSLTYLPNHPKLIAARKELANIARKLRREVSAAAMGFEDQVKAAQAREAALRQDLAALKQKPPQPRPREAPVTFDAAELAVLEQTAAALGAELQELLARDAEAPAMQETPGAPAIARIVQTATAPAGPVSPRTLPLAAIGALAGLLSGLCMAFMAAVMRGKERAEEPVAAAMPALRLDMQHDYAIQPVRAPILAAPPMPPPAPAPEPVQMQAHSDPEPEPAPIQPQPAVTLNPLAVLPARLSVAEVTESLSGGQTAPARKLADSAALMAFWAAKARQTSASRRFGILSFGCSPGDTSAAAVAMARALSRTSKKTVIVDLCRAGSSLEALLGTAAGPGIADLVSGAAEFTKVMARDSRSPVHLLRYGQDRSEWAMGLIEQHIESVLLALENAYDMLIVHTGETVNETPGLIRRCHAALVLAPPNRGNDVAVAIDALRTGALRDAQYVTIEQNPADAARAA